VSGGTGYLIVTGAVWAALIFVLMVALVGLLRSGLEEYQHRRRHWRARQRAALPPEPGAPGPPAGPEPPVVPAPFVPSVEAPAHTAGAATPRPEEQPPAGGAAASSQPAPGQPPTTAGPQAAPAPASEGAAPTTQ